MASRRMYIGGSVLVALLGIGIVIYLIRRKPEVIDKSEHTYFFETKVDESAFERPKSRMEQLIEQSNAAIAADDLEDAYPAKL